MTWTDWITWIDVAVLSVTLVSGLAWYGWYRSAGEHVNERRKVVGICLVCGSLSAAAGCAIGRL